jgi:hypothetical protein
MGRRVGVCPREKGIDSNRADLTFIPLALKTAVPCQYRYMNMKIGTNQAQQLRSASTKSCGKQCLVEVPAIFRAQAVPSNGSNHGGPCPILDQPASKRPPSTQATQELVCWIASRKLKSSGTVVLARATALLGPASQQLASSEATDACVAAQLALQSLWCATRAGFSCDEAGTVVKRCTAPSPRDSRLESSRACA